MGAAAPAMETMVKETEQCYMIANTNMGVTTAIANKNVLDGRLRLDPSSSETTEQRGNREKEDQEAYKRQERLFPPHARALPPSRRYLPQDEVDADSMRCGRFHHLMQHCLQQRECILGLALAQAAHSGSTSHRSISVSLSRCHPNGLEDQELKDLLTSSA